MELLPLLHFLFLTSLSQSSAHRHAPHPHPPSTVAAAGPILQDQPFAVVWNIPTANCHKRYDVHLNLGDFGIVENDQQLFQGEKVTIFYRDHLGQYPYLSRGRGDVNGGIPQLGDLAAHLSLAASQLSALLRPNFTGIAVIDWEEWQPLWERNFGSKMEYRRLSKLLVRQERPGLSEEAVTSLARKKFEECARKFMEETLRMAVGHRPKGFWGFYDDTYTGRCHRDTTQQNDQLSWLWTQSTGLYPSIYLPQRLAGSTDAALMVRHRLLEALRVASLWRHGNNPATPVLPYARLAFTRSLNFLNKTDLQHTVGESASLGAAGVVLWGELKFAKSKQQCILLRDYVHDVLGPYIRSLTSTMRRCSLQLCHGNGRCARRRPGSSISLSLDPQEAAKPSLNHFMCQCFSGWTGQECQGRRRREEDDDYLRT